MPLPATAAAAVRPAPPPARTERPARRSGAAIFRAVLAVSWLSTVVFFLVWGIEYYLLPLHERPYSDLHDLFKPTGTVGNRLGIAGTLLLVIGVGSYMLRKRWHRLHGLGKLRDWLSFHIWCCTLGPALVLLHTSFRIGGLVAIAFWAMVLVVLSGVVGRFVYVRIPKTLNGKFQTMAELDDHRQELLDQMRDGGLLTSGELARLDQMAAPGSPHGLLHALVLGARLAPGRRRLDAELRQMLDSDRASAPISQALRQATAQYRRLSLQRALLEPFERLFRYWHTFHLPLAIVMLLIVMVHIGVAIAFGYAWTP